MKKLIFAATVFACGLSILTGCTKSLNPAGEEPSGNETSTTSGRIQLTTEGYKGDTKSSVLDNSVQWVNGDVITLNGVEYPVTVENGNAYINAGDLSGVSEIFASYPTGVFFDYGGWYMVFPSKYDSSIDDNGRQVIALPMMAYADNSGNDVTSLEFKHQTAAVKVMLWNATETDLTVTRIVVKTENYALNGDLDDHYVNISEHYTNPMYKYEPETDDLIPSYRRVDVNFPGYDEAGSLVIPAGTDFKSVQVPFRPIDEDSMTIEIHLTDGTNPYVYRYTASNPALTRNQMMTARAKLDLTTGNMRSAVVDLSTISGDYVAEDGDVLTGELGGSYNLQIAEGATVTLAGMTHHAGQYVFGIECLGSATIILAPGTVNDLTPVSEGAYHGIYFNGMTLTIEGPGTLNVSGGNGVAGICCERVQELVINGGKITATGGEFAAGIGGYYGSEYGDITINGGTIVAIGGKWAAGIGAGYDNNSRCGKITITDGVTRLTAIRGENNSYYIGGSKAGTITVDGVSKSASSITDPDKTTFEHFTHEISTTYKSNDTWTLTHK